MIAFTGKSVFPGIAIGKLFIYKKQKKIVKKHSISNVDQEIQRVQSAIEKAKQELDSIAEKAALEEGKDQGLIFEIHSMMLGDEDYQESIYGIIRTKKMNAEYAVEKTCEIFANQMLSLNNDYMKTRVADLKDISERVARALSRSSSDSPVIHEPSIIFSDNLTPSETVQLDKNLILGIAITHGSENSHSAIIARAMGIPAVFGIGGEPDDAYNGKTAIIDSCAGKLIIDPSKTVISEMRQIQSEMNTQKELLLQFKGLETITANGRKINLYANITNLAEAQFALENDAEGIGLFRSEFLYLENQGYPSEEQQFEVYKQIAEKMKEKKVIIRTLDIGADKQAPYFHLPAETNPALGCRAIRLCLTRKDIFMTQLKAIYRAAVYGNISIMIPMIISVDEIIQVKQIISEIKHELSERNIAFKSDIDLGIMVETPAAVIISDLLAKEVDFFCLGTNDLTQYTLAIDRQNAALEKFFDKRHPAILKMIRTVVENAHSAGIWIGICGELGADLGLTELFLQMGIDELSVSPTSILPLRKKIREINLNIQ